MEVSLTSVGPPVEIVPGGALRLGPRAVVPAKRLLDDLKPVLGFPDRVSDPGAAAYFMYRGAHLPEHEPLFEEAGLRFDITVIPPRVLGEEYIKTKGHYHSQAPDGLNYPEVYQVLQGKAVLLLQKPGNDPGEVEDLIAVRAFPGDAIVIPPGYGHVTINPCRETLVMANLIASECRSDYGPFVKLRGASFYLTTSGFVRNRLYSRSPPPRVVDARAPMGFDGPLSIYELFVRRPGAWAFLTRPSALPSSRTPWILPRRTL